MKRKILVAIVFVVAGALLLLVPPVKQVSAEPLRVGISKDIKTALIRLADAQGYFKKQAVEVVIKEYDSGAQAVNDLIGDKLDIATAAEFVFVLQSSKHPDLRIPATVCLSSDNELVVRKDRDIARPQDLKGKSVAVTQGTAGEFFFYNYLIFNRIPAASVHVVYHNPSEMVKAMADGTIDAALSWPPFTTQMAGQLGAKGARWPAQSGQDYYFVLVAKEGFLKKQPKTMEQFLAALLEAEKFIEKYPDRAQAIVRNRVKADAESFPGVWSRSRYQLQLTQDLLVLMEREAKWAIRNKLVEEKKMPNYLHFFYFNALDNVKPEAVSIVH